MGQHLKAAKSLLNPPGDETPLDFSIVQICIMGLKEGKWGFDSNRLSSLYAVTWGTPSYYQQAIDLIAQVPPPYMVRTYDDWYTKYARIAQRLGVFDGSYAGYGSLLEIPYRLAPETVAQIMAAGD